MTGVGVTHIGLSRSKHKPPVAHPGGHIAEPELDDGASPGQDFEIDPAVHVPEEQLGVKVLALLIRSPNPDPEEVR